MLQRVKYGANWTHAEVRVESNRAELILAHPSTTATIMLYAEVMYPEACGEDSVCAL